MKKIEAIDAKAHFSELLDRVGHGENIIITRDGIPAAVLAPISRVGKLSHHKIVEGMRALRKRVKPGKMSIKQMINEGRRY
jgi:prevent-host-death family protein